MVITRYGTAEHSPPEVQPLVRITALPFTLVVGAYWMVLVSAPRLISLGPITVSGLGTILVAILTVTLLPTYVLTTQQRRAASRDPEPMRTRVPWPLWAFLCLLVLSSLRTAAIGALDPDSLQNLCVYVSFLGAIAFATTVNTKRVTARAWELLRRMATFTAYLAAISELADFTFLGSRPMALVGLVVLAIIVPGTPSGIWMKWAPLAMVAAIALSLSRTGTVIGLSLLVFVVLRGRRGRRLTKGILLLALASLATYMLVAFYAPFRDRFLVGDAAFQLGSLSISTQGRARFWELLTSNMTESWLLGQGIGSSARLIAATIPGQSHPHNDYLRIFFEFGLVGAGLFIVGYFMLLSRVLTNARISDHPLHWAAFIAMISVGVTALTDNPFVYPFVMLPLGSLAGLSLALARLECTTAGSPAPNGLRGGLD